MLGGGSWGGCRLGQVGQRRRQYGVLLRARADRREDVAAGGSPSGARSTRPGRCSGWTRRGIRATPEPASTRAARDCQSFTACRISGVKPPAAQTERVTAPQQLRASPTIQGSVASSRRGTRGRCARRCVGRQGDVQDVRQQVRPEYRRSVNGGASAKSTATAKSTSPASSRVKRLGGSASTTAMVMRGCVSRKGPSLRQAAGPRSRWRRRLW